MPWTTENPHIYGVAWWREGQRIGVAFDFDPDAVDRIKQIRTGARKFDPGLRCWFVTDEALALDLIAELPQFVGGPPEFFEGRPPWLAARAEWITMRGWEQKQQRREDERESRRKRRKRQRAGEGSSSGFGESTPHRVLHLTTDAPPELVAAAYRALAKLHHPDAGGDLEKMKAINIAFEELTR